MRAAFKEWAIVVDALGRGDQIIILRKGGIHEGRGGFQVDHPEFLLFPTLFHQQRESVLPEAQERYDALAPTLPGPEAVTLEYFAKIVTWKKIEDRDGARRLQGRHIWKESVIEERFDWGKGKGIFALCLRVHRLPRPVTLPMDESYGGCKSWIELVQDIDVAGSTPVLSDDVFATQLNDLTTSLESVSS